MRPAERQRAPTTKKVAQGGFRTVLWNAPKDLRAAVEDVVAFCTYSTVPEELLSKLATGSDLAAACLIQPYGGAQLAARAWLSVRVVRRAESFHHFLCCRGDSTHCYVQPIMGPQHLFIDIEATKSSFTWVYRIDNLP